MENQLRSSPECSAPPNLALLDSFMVKCDHSYSNDSSEIDEEKCYIMEIEQLKRQNNFLKKKLAEFNKKQRLSLPVGVKKRPPSNFGSELVLEDSQQNYIIGFIQEITKLIESFSNLFRIQLQSNLYHQLQKQNNLLNQLTSDKHDDLNRRLSRLLLEPEQTKYKALLELFEGYYRQTTERGKNLRQRVESLTAQAIQMGKRMAVNVKQKQKVRGSMKGSRILSVIKEPQEMRDGTDEFMKSSIIKSTCTDSQYDFGACRMALGKQKLFVNIF